MGGPAMASTVLAALVALSASSVAATLPPATKKPAAHPTTVAQHDCTYTSPDGSVFDLSPLTRVAGQSDWSVSDNQFVYLFNVCGDVVDKPPSCQAGVHSAGYQYEPGSSPNCYFLGQTSKYEWSLADPAKPWKGIELTYQDGQLCPNKKPRQMRCCYGRAAWHAHRHHYQHTHRGVRGFHFICSR